MTDWTSRPGCHLITRPRSTRAVDWRFLTEARQIRFGRQIEKRYWNHGLASAPLLSEVRIGVRHEGRVAEWFKAPVLKTGRGFTLPRGFESHPFRHATVFTGPHKTD